MAAEMARMAAEHARQAFFGATGRNAPQASQYFGGPMPTEGNAFLGQQQAMQGVYDAQASNWKTDAYNRQRGMGTSGQPGMVRSNSMKHHDKIAHQNERSAKAEAFGDPQTRSVTERKHFHALGQFREDDVDFNQRIVTRMGGEVLKQSQSDVREHIGPGKVGVSYKIFNHSDVSRFFPTVNHGKPTRKGRHSLQYLAHPRDVDDRGFLREVTDAAMRAEVIDEEEADYRALDQQHNGDFYQTEDAGTHMKANHQYRDTVSALKSQEGHVIRALTSNQSTLSKDKQYHYLDRHLPASVDPFHLERHIMPKSTHQAKAKGFMTHRNDQAAMQHKHEGADPDLPKHDYPRAASNKPKPSRGPVGGNDDAINAHRESINQMIRSTVFPRAQPKAMGHSVSKPDPRPPASNIKGGRDHQSLEKPTDTETVAAPGDQPVAGMSKPVAATQSTVRVETVTAPSTDSHKLVDNKRNAEMMNGGPKKKKAKIQRKPHRKKRFTSNDLINKLSECGLTPGCDFSKFVAADHGCLHKHRNHADGGHPKTIACIVDSFRNRYPMLSELPKAGSKLYGTLRTMGRRHLAEDRVPA